MNSEIKSHQTLSNLQIIRLSLIQGCLGCLAVIFAGMLNRVMISELSFPAILVGGSLAFEQLMAPSRVLFGNISDNKPILNYQRTPYIIFGALGFCSLSVLSIPIIFQTEYALKQGDPLFIILMCILLCGIFALYGLSISMATTPYLALVIDMTNEDQRPKAVGIIWCMLTVGIVVGAISISIATKNLDGITNVELLRINLQNFISKVSLIILAICIFSCIGIEKKKEISENNSSKNAKNIGLIDSWKIINSSKQIKIFFGFLVLYTLGLFLQDPILESFGAEVFGLPISQTTLLNAFWGVGTLVGLLIGGLIITPRLGKFNTARLGCWLIFWSLILLVLSGFSQSKDLLFGILVIFGISAGIATNSALSLMLDLTVPEVAGTFVGVWGLAQAFSRAMGKVFGGGLLDIGRSIGGPSNELFAFSSVFIIESLIVLSSIYLLSKVNLNNFKKETETNIQQLLIQDLDN